jgi:hypothetical protein
MDVSADGLTVVGEGINPDGNEEGWIAVLSRPCDFNRDNLCDVADIDLMFGIGDISVGVSASPGDAVLDMNGDGTIDSQDVDQWLDHAASENGFASTYLFGDSNLDGSVTAIDLNALALSWRESGAVWSSGDFTGDGSVNAEDLNLLGLNWRTALSIAAASQNVPEPAAGSSFLAAVGLLILGCRNTRFKVL